MHANTSHIACVYIELAIRSHRKSLVLPLLFLYIGEAHREEEGRERWREGEREGGREGGRDGEREGGRDGGRDGERYMYVESLLTDHPYGQGKVLSKSSQEVT